MKRDILVGDVREQLRTLPDASVDTVVTSPPYWALRDYGVSGQLGLEPTWREHMANLRDVFREVHRVLKPTGNLWGELRGHWDDDGSTVWQVQRDANPQHPTQKPVQIPARAIRNSTLPGELVVDPFLGSGSTLVAAEQLGRRCAGIEIDPAYVDVAIQRIVKLTGKVPTRNDGESWRAPS